MENLKLISMKNINLKLRKKKKKKVINLPIKTEKVVSVKKFQIFGTCPYIIILDAGHGVDTPGKRSPEWEDGSQLFEWDYNRKIVSRIVELFEENGISYRILVPEDKDISLEERVQRANDFYDNVKTPCLYISIHGNASGVEEANGFEIFTSPGQTKSDLCATEIFNRIEENELFKLRKDMSDGDPDKESRFYVLMHTKMPAILTENGFFTNEVECKKMMTYEFRDSIAQSHLIGIKKIISKRLLG
jgi:N-acetylmuramoyl-L-alanine amidase